MSGKEGEMTQWQVSRQLGQLFVAISDLSRYEGGGGFWQMAFLYMVAIHLNQTRPGGDLQILHCARVGLRAAQYADHNLFSGDRFDALVAIALLHDSIEDSNIHREDLAKEFNGEVADAVQAVSHIEEEETDEVYLDRVEKGGLLAIVAKRCDRLDNLVSLGATPADFRAIKVAQVQAALPIWQRIDPEGAVEIEAELKKLQAVL